MGLAAYDLRSVFLDFSNAVARPAADPDPLQVGGELYKESAARKSTVDDYSRVAADQQVVGNTVK